MSQDIHEALAGKKVLLVEDDNFFVDLVAQKLSAHCTFDSVGTGEDAMAKLQKEVPDIVLLDIMLPGGMDGFAVLEKMKADENLKKIPVIILSNLSRPADIERGMKLGAFRYLVKASIVPSDIVGHIVSVFGSPIK